MVLRGRSKMPKCPLLSQKYFLFGTGLGLNIFLGMKLFFLKFRLFSGIAVDFILISFLFTHIRIVILTNKKYFLHRASLQRKAKRPREILPPIRTFCFDHFTVENTRNEWYGDSKICRDSLIRNVRY